MLHINELTFRFGGRVIFDHATVAIPKGHRVALVGRNGTGKTTLLRLIAGEMPLDGGSITRPAEARLGIVAQEAPGSDGSLIDTVLAADVERTALLAESETAHDPHRIAEIHTRLADIHAHSAPARAAQILSGLGFDAESQTRPCSDFSGGWRMRVALAGVLFAEPELLLLDEPTNHLDLEATIWLENYLRNYPHTILLVSHDRELLNKVPTTTVHLDQGKLTSYAGGYDQFERTRRANLERLASNQAKQIAQRKHIQSYIDRFRYKASKARQAQSRIKMLERMEPLISIVEDHTVTFDFPSPNELAPPLIQLEGVDVGYDGKAILRNLDLRIDMDDRIALLGANGNGKSTLVKLLAGRLAPMVGEITRADKLSMAYFAQHQLDELNEDASAYDHVRKLMGDAPESKVRARAGAIGFSGKAADTKAGKLSGGEKARLLLGLATFFGPNMIILDEPTNHLDIDSRAALAKAINEFPGAIIMVSHDRYLIEACAERLWVVANQTVTAYDGDLEDYRRLVLSSRNGEPAPRERSAPSEKPQRPKSDNRGSLKKRIAEAETEIARVSEIISKIDTALALPDIFTRDPKQAAQLSKARANAADALSRAEEQWLEASTQFDAAAG